MIKEIETGHSVNWADDKYMVGFETSHQCCEQTGWTFVDEEGKELGLKPLLDDYVFTGEFIEDLKVKGLDDDSIIESSGCFNAAFEIKSNSDEKCYLVIYNYHNGYYSHGFEFRENKSLLHEGGL